MEIRFVGYISFLFIGCIYGFCMHSSLKTEKTEFGTLRRFCEYHVDENNNTVTLQIMPGSRFETRDCMECFCSDQGFKCCGIGINSRMFWVPDDCKVVSNGCEPLIVLKSDIYLDCFTKRPIQPVRKVSPRMEKQRKLRRMLKRQRIQQQKMGKEVEVEGSSRSLMNSLAGLSGLANFQGFGGLGQLGGLTNLMGGGSESNIGGGMQNLLQIMQG